MDKHEVARILDNIAFLLEIQNENPFKVRAYHNAARAIEGLDEDLENVVKEKRLEEIPSIGEKIAKNITLLVNKGTLPYFERLKKQVPPVLIELMEVQGLGPKKVAILYEKLNIKSLEELAQACIEGKIAQLRGFGIKTQENILRNIRKRASYKKRVLWWEAQKLAYPLLEKLSQLKEVKKVDVAGSFRRKLETVGDLDFIVASTEPEAVMNWFTSQPEVEVVQAKGTTKSSVRLNGGIQCDIRIVSEDQYAFALVYFTGSKEFNIILRQRANHLGLTLSEYSLLPLNDKGKKGLSCRTEEDVLRVMKLAYIPPELREGHEIFEAAEKGKVPQLIEDSDIKGVFHCHTTDSDGHNTLEEMVKAAQDMGLDYIGLADHSKSSFQANGMDEKRLLNQVARIERLNRSKKYQTYVFAGLECDILPDGTLDFSDSILKELDYVIVSIHKSFKYEEKKMTERLIRAIENPYTTIVAHVTGRLLLKRDPYALNLPKVIDACIANNKIMELNAHPMRLDMDWRLWHKASEKGLKCAINPDAHSTSDLFYYRAGVNSARKGWLEKKHIINTLPLASMKKFLLD